MDGLILGLSQVMARRDAHVTHVTSFVAAATSLAGSHQKKMEPDLITLDLDLPT